MKESKAAFNLYRRRPPPIEKHYIQHQQRNDTLQFVHTKPIRSDVLLVQFVYTPYYTWNLLNSFIYWHEPRVGFELILGICYTTHTKSFRFSICLCVRIDDTHWIFSVKRIFDEWCVVSFFPPQQQRSWCCAHTNRFILLNVCVFANVWQKVARERACRLPQIKMRITNW